MSIEEKGGMEQYANWKAPTSAKTETGETKKSLRDQLADPTERQHIVDSLRSKIQEQIDNLNQTARPSEHQTREQDELEDYLHRINTVTDALMTGSLPDTVRDDVVRTTGKAAKDWTPNEGNEYLLRYAERELGAIGAHMQVNVG